MIVLAITDPSIDGRPSRFQIDTMTRVTTLAQVLLSRWKLNSLSGLVALCRVFCGAHYATLVEYLSDVFHPIRNTLTRTFVNFIDVKMQQSYNTL